MVCLTDLVHGAIQTQVALLDPYGTLTNALNLLHEVRNEQDRDVTALDKVLNKALALLLEKGAGDRNTFDQLSRKEGSTWTIRIPLS